MRRPLQHVPRHDRSDRRDDGKNHPKPPPIRRVCFQHWCSPSVRLDTGRRTPAMFQISSSLTPLVCPHQNDGVRGRVIAIVLALVVLAFAETRHDDRASEARHQGNATSGQLAAPPAPQPDLPAIITAAVKTSTTVRTALVVESRHQLNPALSVSSVSRHLPVVAYSTGKPRAFPLLI